MYALFGNNGAYRMPESPEFETMGEARAYFWRFWPSGNKYIVIQPV